LFMISFLSRDNWSIRGKHEMNSWIWYKIGLEFSDINIKGTIESKGSSKWGDNLSNKSVKVGIGWSFNIESSSTDIIDSFVIKHNSNISMFKKGVSWKDWVIWFNNSSWYLWGWVNCET
jgi:hypothetical protein